MAARAALVAQTETITAKLSENESQIVSVRDEIRAQRETLRVIKEATAKTTRPAGA